MKRYVVYLTAAQREALLEATGFRLAGPLDGADQRQATYEAAEKALREAKLRTVSTAESFSWPSFVP